MITNSHIQKYVGDYANNDDFIFQEEMRRMDLAVRDIALKSTNNIKASAFIDKGWGQVISMSYLLDVNPGQLKISDTYRLLMMDKLNQAIVKGKGENDPFFTVNVRGLTRPMMMHPTHPLLPGKYFDWQAVELKKPIDDLNQFVKIAKLQYSVEEGKLFLNINLEDKSNFFDKLWETNFEKLLEEKGYTGLERNIEHPHVTLINSEIITSIKDAFDSKYGADGKLRYEEFFKNFLHLINEDLGNQEMPVLFTELSSTYSEDHSPFEEVVVAKLESQYTEKVLQLIIKQVEQELNIQIPVKPKSSYHLTVATKYRKPHSSLPEQMENVIKNTGAFTKKLNHYWEKFIKV